jgi:hypothetical protein
MNYDEAKSEVFDVLLPKRGQFFVLNSLPPPGNGAELRLVQVSGVLNGRVFFFNSAYWDGLPLCVFWRYCENGALKRVRTDKVGGSLSPL